MQQLENALIENNVNIPLDEDPGLDGTAMNFQEERKYPSLEEQQDL